MISFTISWFFTAFLLVLSFYFYSKLHFFKTLFLKTKVENDSFKNKTINDLAVIELYEKEVKKNKDNLRFLQDELVNSYVAIKELKNKQNRLKSELVESDDKIKTMKTKLNMLF